MLDVSIAKEDQEKVKTQRFEHPDVHVQRRLHILYFKSLGYAHKDICLLAGVSYTTIEPIAKPLLRRGFAIGSPVRQGVEGPYLGLYAKSSHDLVKDPLI